MAYYQNPNYNHKYTPPTYDTITSWYRANSATRSWANPLNGFDPIPFFCQLLKVANLPEIEPVVSMQKEDGFDYENYLETYFVQLTAIGDNRVNFYDTWKEISTEYLPKIITQVELAQTGGCQVINGYICNSDGIPIIEASNTCKEGEEYTKPVLYEDVIEKTKNFIQKKKDEHADYFIQYVSKKYINNPTEKWNVALIFYPNMYSFITELSSYKNGSNVMEYIKYYWDSKDYVSEKLKINITQRYTFPFNTENYQNGIKMFENFSAPIPNFKDLVNNL